MRRLLILTAVMVVLAFAACGNDDDVATDTTTTTAPPTETTEIELFFTPAEAVDTDCGAVEAVTREVSGDPVEGALEQLVAGPTADEREAGLESWFSEETAGALIDVTVADGVAAVDFMDLRPIIPNASSSCGSAMLLAQLDATATQFAEVERAVYSLDGDVDAFYEWLQLSPPEG